MLVSEIVNRAGEDEPGLVQKAADSLGLTKQSVYARMRSDTRTSSLVEMIEAMGGQVQIKLSGKTYRLSK